MCVRESRMADDGTVSNCTWEGENEHLIVRERDDCSSSLMLEMAKLRVRKRECDGERERGRKKDTIVLWWCKNFGIR